jgi:putative DNA primase/helicase
VVASGLERLPDLRLGRMPRMADFAKWITACEPALRWRDGEFMEIYAANLES